MLIITGQKSQEWPVVYFNAVIGLSHGNSLNGFTKLRA